MVQTRPCNDDSRIDDANLQNISVIGGACDDTIDRNGAISRDR